MRLPLPLRLRGGCWLRRKWPPPTAFAMLPQEPWIIGLLSFHGVLLVAVLALRRNQLAQGLVFFFISKCGCRPATSSMQLLLRLAAAPIVRVRSDTPPPPACPPTPALWCSAPAPPLALPPCLQWGWCTTRSGSTRWRRRTGAASLGRTTSTRRGSSPLRCCRGRCYSSCLCSW